MTDGDWLIWSRDRRRRPLSTGQTEIPGKNRLSLFIYLKPCALVVMII